MAVLGGGGSASPAARRASMAPLMRASTAFQHAAHQLTVQQPHSPINNVPDAGLDLERELCFIDRQFEIEWT
jgi:hypothetical protein